MKYPDKHDTVEFFKQRFNGATSHGPELDPGVESDLAQWVEGELDLSNEEAIQALLGIPPFEYDQIRKKAADRLGCRVSTLDDELKRLRADDEGETTLFEEPEPWPEPVDGAELITEIRDALQTHVVFPVEAATTAALWVLHTYVLDAAEASPILAITSPEKRCGKTTLLSVLSAIVYRPAGGSAFTKAAIYRVVEKYRPTLLVDEADTFIGSGDNVELRGVINSGHTRRMAHVWVCVGDDHEPTRFSTWAPKAIACIGTLPDTIADRSIEVRMRRKTKGDNVRRYRERIVSEMEDLRQRCRRWAEDNIDALRLCDPDVPKDLSDRAADSWATLLAIADQAGGDWPTEARTAAKKLSGTGAADTATIRTNLLRDLNSIFKAADNPEAISSADLLRALHKMDERPWPTYHRGKELSARGLADLLRPFDIESENIREGDKVLKGYKLEAFGDAFARYLPDLTATTLQAEKNGDPEPERRIPAENHPLHGSDDVADRKGQNRSVWAGNAESSAVADNSGISGGKQEKATDWHDEMIQRGDEEAPF